MNVIPGRLQTADYIQALADQAARRELFHWSREFVFYIHEQALRLPVGGVDLMKDQLLHLLAMAQRSYIALRVVPIAVGAHAGLGGSFMQLRYEKFEPVIYLKGENSSLFLEDKASLSTYDKVLKLLDRQALDAEHSKELITSILL